MPRRDWKNDAAFALDRFCRVPRTLDEITAYLGIGDRDAEDVIQTHRRHAQDRALVHFYDELGPARGLHLYVVTSDPEKICDWLERRFRDGDNRFRTMLDVAQVAVRRADPDSLEGRTARVYVKHLSRLLEDIEALIGGVLV